MSCLTFKFCVMGLFRRMIRKVYDVGAAAPILSERQSTKVVDVNGVEVQKVIFESVDVSTTKDSECMPNASEWDLDEQLKQGFAPEKLSVKGMLPSDSEEMEYKTILALNSLQSQLDELKSEPMVEESKDV